MPSPGQRPGGYEPFKRLLREDGYQVEETATAFTRSVLDPCKLLVLVGPLAAENAEDWQFPHPSAFSTAELVVLYQWIQRGGGLFLISDHAPMVGAVSDLATMLGAVMLDGSARLANSNTAPLPDLFTRAAGTLVSTHPIVRGRRESESIDTVGTWAGAAFRTSRQWSPLLVFGEPSLGWTALGVFDELAQTVPRDQWPQFTITGWSHAAARQLDGGRVVLLGEAAACTADSTSGISHPAAPQNAQFCLNAARWLSGLLN